MADDVPRRHRTRPRRVQDAPLRRRKRDGQQRAVVVRNVRRHGALHPEAGVRLGVVQDDVDAVAAHRRRAVVVDVNPVAAHRQRGAQRHRLVVAVHGQLVAVGSADPLDGRLARLLEDELRQVVELLDVELRHHALQPVRAGVVGGGERKNVADHLLGLAHVGADELEQRVIGLAAPEQVQNGDGHPLLEDLARVRPETPPADVHHVAGIGKQPHQPVAVEGRRNHRNVVQVPRGEPRVVGDEHVARLHGVHRVPGDEVPDALGHGVDVTRRAGNGLRQHPAAAVEHAGGEVARLPDAGGKGRAHQGLRLLLDHGYEAVPHDVPVDGGQRGGGAHVVPPYQLPTLAGLRGSSRSRDSRTSGITGRSDPSSRMRIGVQRTLGHLQGCNGLVTVD